MANKPHSNTPEFVKFPFYWGTLSSKAAEDALHGRAKGVFLIRWSSTSEAPIVSWVANPQTGAISHAIVNIGANGELGLQSSTRSYADMGALVNAHRKTLQTPLPRDIGYEIGVQPGVGHAPPQPPSAATATVLSPGPHDDDDDHYPANHHHQHQQQQQPPQQPKPQPQLQPLAAAPVAVPLSPQRSPPAPTQQPQPAQQPVQQPAQQPQPARPVAATSARRAPSPVPAPAKHDTIKSEVDMETGGDDDDDPLMMLAAMADDDGAAAPVPPALPQPPDDDEDLGFESDGEPNAAGSTIPLPATISLRNPVAAGAPAAAAPADSPTPPATNSEYVAAEPLSPRPGASPTSAPTATAPAATGDTAAPASGDAVPDETGDLIGDVLLQGLNYLEVTRKQAEDALLRSPPGSYLVRPSSQANCLALTYVTEVPGGKGGQIGHLLLRNQPTIGWTTEGRPAPFRTLRELLESLPYSLKLRPLQVGAAVTVTTTASPLSSVASSVEASSAASFAAQVVAQQQLEEQRRLAELAAAERRELEAQKAAIAREKAELDAERQRLAQAAARISQVAQAQSAAVQSAPQQQQQQQQQNGRPAAHTVSQAANPAIATAPAGRQPSPSSPPPVQQQQPQAQPEAGGKNPAALTAADAKRQIRRTTRTERGLSTTVQALSNGKNGEAHNGVNSSPSTPPHGGIVGNHAPPGAGFAPAGSFASPKSIPLCSVCNAKPVQTRVNLPGEPGRLTCADCMQKLTQGKVVAHTTVPPQEGFKMVHSAPQPQPGMPRR